MPFNDDYRHWKSLQVADPNPSHWSGSATLNNVGRWFSKPVLETDGLGRSLTSSSLQTNLLLIYTHVPRILNIDIKRWSVHCFAVLLLIRPVREYCFFFCSCILLYIYIVLVIFNTVTGGVRFWGRENHVFRTKRTAYRNKELIVWFLLPPPISATLKLYTAYSRIIINSFLDYSQQIC